MLMKFECHVHIWILEFHIPLISYGDMMSRYAKFLWDSIMLRVEWYLLWNLRCLGQYIVCCVVKHLQQNTPSERIFIIKILLTTCAKWKEDKRGHTSQNWKIIFLEVWMCGASFGCYGVFIIMFLSVLRLGPLSSRYGPSNNMKRVTYSPIWLISSHLSHLSVWEYERSEASAELFLPLRSACVLGIHSPWAR